LTLRWLGILGVGVGLIISTGCSGPATVIAPDYSPAATATAAFSEYDKNNDGKLDEKELESCPALKSSLAQLDKDGDKAISKDELIASLGEFARSKVSLMTARCNVTREGQPLANAEVKFIPEKFHGTAIKPAAGKSNQQGVVELRCEGNTLPGLSLGFYRVEISLKDEAGQETIPASFNSQTTLGQIVTSQMRGGLEINIP